MSANLVDMDVFVQVVQGGSLSAAARELHLSLTVVSRKLARLEDRLGVRLIIRTTQSPTLTEEGARFYERCVRILAEVEDAGGTFEVMNLPFRMSGADVSAGKRAAALGEHTVAVLRETGLSEEQIAVLKGKLPEAQPVSLASA